MRSSGEMTSWLSHMHLFLYKPTQIFLCASLNKIFVLFKTKPKPKQCKFINLSERWFRLYLSYTFFPKNVMKICLCVWDIPAKNPTCPHFQRINVSLAAKKPGGWCKSHLDHRFVALLSYRRPRRGMSDERPEIRQGHCARSTRVHYGRREALLNEFLSLISKTQWSPWARMERKKTRLGVAFLFPFIYTRELITNTFSTFIDQQQHHIHVKKMRRRRLLAAGPEVCVWVVFLNWMRERLVQGGAGYVESGSLRPQDKENYQLTRARRIMMRERESIQQPHSFPGARDGNTMPRWGAAAKHPAGFRWIDLASRDSSAAATCPNENKCT